MKNLCQGEVVNLASTDVDLGVSRSLKIGYWLIAVWVIQQSRASKWSVYSYIGIIQQHSMCKGEQLLLHWISAERNRIGPNVILNSGKVWQWECLANLVNHPWFIKLKLFKLVLTINNLAINWSINSPNVLLPNAQKESICQTFPLCGNSHPIGAVKGPLFIMCVVYIATQLQS